MMGDEVENKKLSRSMKSSEVFPHSIIETETIKFKSFYHRPRAQPVDLNSYRSICLNPPNKALHWSKSQINLQSHQNKDNRMSLLPSPAPFSNLTSDVIDHTNSTLLQRSPTTIGISPSKSTGNRRLNGYMSLPRRLSINRRVRRKESQITFQQESASEISLPLSSNERSPIRSPIFKHKSVSEVVISSSKPNPNSVLWIRHRSPSQRHHHHHKRLSISHPIPESFVHFHLPSGECLPTGRPSAVSRLPPQIRSSFYGDHWYSSHAVSSLESIPDSESPIDHSKSLNNSKRKGTSFIGKVWKQVRMRARLVPNFNKSKRSNVNTNH